MEHDIIEKRPASPISSSLLVIAAICMVGAMLLAAWEIRELKGSEDTATANASRLEREMTRVSARWKSAIRDALDEHGLASEDDDESADDEPAGDADDGGGEDD